MENIKIKPLTKEQLIISIDRLTRFKDTETKYLRVFKDILTSNLLFPKFKKAELDKLNYSELKNFAEYIINFSLEQLGYSTESDFSINEYLYEYENSVFKLDENTQILLQNKINYSAFVKLLKEENNPQNLRWLKAISEKQNIEQARKEKGLKFPIEEVLIVEGATEETLLPEFARKCGFDFDKEGIYILSAGGKNQVVKLYYALVEKLKLPIFVLLDKDAAQNREYILTKLRDSDKVHLLECGEFEDLLPIELVERTLEYELNNISIIEQEMITTEESMVKNLEEVFKTRGMHEFKKVEFAQMVKRNILTDADISPEIRTIVEEIKKLKEKKQIKKKVVDI